MHYLSEVKAMRRTSSGTELILLVPDEQLEYTIDRYKVNNKVLAELRLDDGRSITNQQRKMYYATLKDIADHTGNILEDMHDYFKTLYKFMHEDIHISMSNCTVTQARQMINILVEFALKNDIPLTDLGVNRTDDINSYLYMCIVTRKCVICGKRADIHHVVGSKIGMGNNRNKVNHVGRYAIALCRIHHKETENGIEKEYLEKHKVYPIKLDEYAVKKLKL